MPQRHKPQQLLWLAARSCCPPLNTNRNSNRDIFVQSCANLGDVQQRACMSHTQHNNSPTQQPFPHTNQQSAPPFTPQSQCKVHTARARTPPAASTAAAAGLQASDTTMHIHIVFQKTQSHPFPPAPPSLPAQPTTLATKQKPQLTTPAAAAAEGCHWLSVD